MWIGVEVVAAIFLGYFYAAYRNGSITLWNGCGAEEWKALMQQRNTDRRGRVTSQALFWSAMLGMGSCLFFNNLLRKVPFLCDSLEAVGRRLYSQPILMQICWIGILAPLVEELIFRGLVYYRMRWDFPFLGAAVVSSVCFGWYHGNLAQGIFATILGFLMALLYEVYDSLLVSWIFHAAANLIAVALTYIYRKGYVETDDVAAMPVVMAAGMVLILFSFYKIREDGRKREAIIHSNPML